MNEIVVLLHGAGRFNFSMWKIGRQLAKLGYQIVNIGYPSRRYPIESLAEYIAAVIRSRYPKDASKIHFVTHSLGGIVLRYYLKICPLPNLGRVVMLAPPNRGTELSDFFTKNTIYQWMVGPIGDQLSASPSSFVNTLGPADYPLGVIAGNKSLNPLFSRLLPGPDDGRIAVERTQLEGMVDFITMPYSHSLIMFYQTVIRQIINFLTDGCFVHPT